MRKFCRQLRVEGSINPSITDDTLKDIVAMEIARQVFGQKVNLYSLVQFPPKKYEDFYGTRRQLLGAWCSLLAVRFNGYDLSIDENVRLGRVLPILGPFAADSNTPISDIAKLPLDDI